MNPPESPYLGQGCRSPYPPSELIRQRVWRLVQATVFRWSPEPLHVWRAWLLRVFGADIPAVRQVVIFPTARVYAPWKLRLEPRSMIGRNVTIYNLGATILRRGANVSQNTHLCAGSHDFRRWDMPLITGPIEVGENAWIAADVFVGPNVRIGELCVVGARSVVIRDLPSRTICVGNPCRPIGPRALPQCD